jgi:hypothetical protein
VCTRKITGISDGHSILSLGSLDSAIQEAYSAYFCNSKIASTMAQQFHLQPFSRTPKILRFESYKIETISSGVHKILVSTEQN